MVDPQHGIDGWELDDYEWDEKTGVARFEYTRTLVDGTIEGRVVAKAQPANRTHTGWYMR